MLHTNWLAACLAVAMAGLATDCSALKTPTRRLALTPAVQKERSLHRRRIHRAFVGKNVLLLAPAQYPILTGNGVGGHLGGMFSSEGFHDCSAVTRASRKARG